MKTNTIFVSIAAYCDERLTATINDAISKAKYPDKLRFGIVEQREKEKRIVLTAEQRKTIRYLGVDPVESRGACWARAVVMSMYCNEDWYFQIDSHMWFEQDWDEWFVNESIKCLKFSDKPIISSYPRLFTLVDGQPKVSIERGVTANVLYAHPSAPLVFGPDNYTLLFLKTLVNTSKAVYGYHIGGNCLFAAGNFVYEIPYDPQFYFEGEEQAIAIRAYTHGWDILCVADMPIYHLQDRETRDAHWEGDVDNSRGDNHWWVLKEQAIRRLTDLVSGKDLGIYSLGTKRSTADYAKFCGINYPAATLDDKAWRGPWIQVLE